VSISKFEKFSEVIPPNPLQRGGERREGEGKEEGEGEGEGRGGGCIWLPRGMDAPESHNRYLLCQRTPATSSPVLLTI
jgi:hypothetical protein